MTDPARQRLKRWLSRLGFFFILAFLLLNALAYRQAYAMTHFTASQSRTDPPEKLSIGQKIGVLLWGISLPRSYAKDTAEAMLGPAAKSFKISEDDHVTLGAWYYPGPSNSPLVILFHGYGGEKSSSVPEAKVFLNIGCSVLLVDFRGAGDSSESYTTIGYDEADDVASAVNFAQKQFAPPKIILYGKSMGAVAILRAIHIRSVKPDAVILEAVFDRLLTTVRHRFEVMKIPSFPCAELLVFWGGVQGGFNGFHHNPVDYAVDVTCPALFLHGAADPRARLDEGRRVFDAVRGPKEFKEFPDVGHASTVSRCPVEWKKTVADFLGANHVLTSQQRIERRKVV